MKLIVLVFSLFVASQAFAQNLHMIEMNTTSSTLGALTFVDDGDDTDMVINLGGSYAYKISERVQLGLQGNYDRRDGDRTNSAYDIGVGGIYNFNDDLTNTLYTSLYAGMGWARSGDSTDEAWRGTVALGKRFALSNINLPNVTYSPEIAYTRAERIGSSYGTNILAIRFLQFSVFF